MKKINSIFAYAVMAFIFVLFGSAASVSAQALPQKDYEGSFNDFRVKATVYANEKKDDKGNRVGWENCRVTIRVINTSSKDIMRWNMDYAVSNDAKKFESRTKKNGSWLKAGDDVEIVFPYCGVQIYDITKN